MKAKFFKCNICGNVVIKAVEGAGTLVCCGQNMEELKASTSDTGSEKHVPVIEHIDEHTIKVKVGSVTHPMLPEHHISFICIETEDGIQVAYPKETPEAIFHISSPVIAVYEYCNIHGLWKI